MGRKNSLFEILNRPVVDLPLIKVAALIAGFVAFQLIVSVISVPCVLMLATVKERWEMRTGVDHGLFGLLSVSVVVIIAVMAGYLVARRIYFLIYKNPPGAGHSTESVSPQDTQESIHE